MQCWTGASGRKGHREMHTTLGLQNHLRGFTSTFSHLMIALLLKRHVPPLAPATLPQYSNHPGCLVNWSSKLIWTKKKSYKNTNNFQMGCSPIDLIAWPCNYRHWPVRHRGEGMGWSHLFWCLHSLQPVKLIRKPHVLWGHYKVCVIWKVFAVTSDLFYCMWNHGSLSHSFR